MANENQNQQGIPSYLSYLNPNGVPGMGIPNPASAYYVPIQQTNLPQGYPSKMGGFIGGFQGMQQLFQNQALLKQQQAILRAHQYRTGKADVDVGNDTTQMPGAPVPPEAPAPDQYPLAHTLEHGAQWVGHALGNAYHSMFGIPNNQGPPTTPEGTQPLQVEMPGPTSDPQTQVEPKQHGGPVGIPSREISIPRPLPWQATPGRVTGVNGSHQAMPGISGYQDAGPVGGPMDTSQPADPNGIGPPSPAPQPAPQYSALPPGGQTGDPAADALASQATTLSGHTNELVSHLNQELTPLSGRLSALGAPAPTSNTEWYDRAMGHANNAIKAAIAEGYDPGMAYNTYMHMVHSTAQTGFLRGLSEAHTALLSNDTKGVEQGLRDANYYTPHGQELNVRRDNDGNLLYQDPIYPQNEKGDPNFIKVDAEHLKLLGMSALDPQNVASELMNYRSIPLQRALLAQKSNTEAMSALGSLRSGTGTLFRGEGIKGEAAVAANRAGPENVKDLAAAHLDEARAAWQGYTTQFSARAAAANNSVAAKNVSQVPGLLDNLILGPPTQIQPMMPDPKHPGMQMMNPSYAPGRGVAGNMSRDSTRALPAFRNLSAEQYGTVMQLSSELAAGGLPAGAAVGLIANFIANRTGTHPGAGGKGQEPNIRITNDPKTGQRAMAVWNGKNYNTYPLVDPGSFDMQGGIPNPGAGIPQVPGAQAAASTGAPDGQGIPMAVGPNGMRIPASALSNDEYAGESPVPASLPTDTMPALTNARNKDND